MKHDIERLKKVKLVKQRAIRNNPLRNSANRLIDNSSGGTSRNFNRKEWANSYLSRLVNDSPKEKETLHR